ncbi:MAG TPA: crotonase/enoyl-CoA hydratase family protein [Alphaproteobacteria bacterium]|nr:crotonase/enoyl-CoA hydratase family protein [Alphaproteobacteria bacterium]
MAFETLLIDMPRPGIARLTLNRPEAHNALSGAMLDELPRALGELESDPGVRVVVLTGAGESFCAGGDLRWMEEVSKLDRAGRIAASGKIATLLAALDRLAKPLVGRINGPAYGGGVGLVAVCDVAIAARGARFGLTEVRLGLLPANIGPYVVARLGPAKAREILFNGKLFAAEEAERLGLVSRAVDAAELDAAVEREAGYFLQCGPQAVARTKALIHHIARHGPSESIDHAIAALADAWEGDESKEGIAAFFAKRKPRWTS